MDRHARHFDTCLDFDVFCTGGLQHFRGLGGGVFHQRGFVVAVRHRNSQSWNAPGVF